MPAYDDNRYTDNIANQHHIVFNTLSSKLKTTMHVALNEYVMNKIFVPKHIQDKFCKHLWNNVSIYSTLSKLGDVICIFGRELDRFYREWHNRTERIIRLDGSAGRMIQMTHLLWNLCHPSYVTLSTLTDRGCAPKQVCVDINPDTVDQHSQHPLVSQAVKSDVYTYLLGQRLSSTTTIYMDFCSLPGNGKLHQKLISNASELQSVMSVNPDAFWAISYGTLGWKRPDIRKNHFISWKKQLQRNNVVMRKASPIAQKPMFVTVYLHLENSPTSIMDVPCLEDMAKRKALDSNGPGKKRIRHV